MSGFSFVDQRIFLANQIYKDLVKFITEIKEVRCLG